MAFRRSPLRATHHNTFSRPPRAERRHATGHTPDFRCRHFQRFYAMPKKRSRIEPVISAASGLCSAPTPSSPRRALAHKYRRHACAASHRVTRSRAGKPPTAMPEEARLHLRRFFSPQQRRIESSNRHRRYAPGSLSRRRPGESSGPASPSYAWPRARPLPHAPLSLIK